MLKKIKNYTKEFHTYSKKMKACILLTASSSLLVIISVTLIFSFFIKKEINQKKRSFITTSCETIDREIVDQLHDYLYDNLDKYFHASSFSLFYERADNDKDFFSSIRISIIDSIKFKNYISNLTLYRVYDNAVVSARNNGYSMEGLTTSYDDIKSILALGEIKEPYFNITADNLVTYIYPVTNQNQWKGSTYRGFAGLCLKAPDVFFHTEVENYNSSGTFLVLCGNTVLCAEGINTLSDDIIFEMINDNPENTMIKKSISSLNYTYYYKYSSASDLLYLYYEPTPSFIDNFIHNVNYLAAYLLIIIIIILFSMLRYITLIQSQRISTSKKQITAEYADSLMKLNNPSGVDIVIQKYLSLEAHNKHYSILMIEPDVKYLSDLTVKQKNILGEEFREVAKKLFRTYELPNIVSLQLKGTISCIINYNDNLNIKDIIYQLSEEFQKYSKCTFNIFYTEAFSDTPRASEAYKRMIQLMKYSFLHNYSNIFSLGELERYESNTQIIEPKVIETVAGYLNDLNPDNLIEYLRKTLFHIRSNGYSYSQSIDFFNLVFCALKDFFIERSFYYELRNVPLTEQLSRFKSLEDCISFIATSISTYRESKLSHSTPTNRNNIENILQYIERDIENVTLSSVAEEFHITSAHLSRIFKDNVGTNFSEYISEKKLIKAAELLKENTNLSIIDIATKLGYNTPSYFSLKFKERFGVTPGVYKKAIINNKVNVPAYLSILKS